MYNEIEQEFRRKHINRKFMKIIVGILLVPLLLFLVFTKNIWWQIIINILSIVVTVCYINIYISGKVDAKKRTFKNIFNFKSNYIKFVKLTANQNRNNLVEILKKNNLYRREQIKEMREYYSNNKKQEYKPSAWEILVLIIGSFITVWLGVMSIIKDFSTNELILNVVVFIAFIIFIIVIVYSIKDLREVYKILFDKYDIEDILERALSEIYIDMCK